MVLVRAEHTYALRLCWDSSRKTPPVCYIFCPARAVPTTTAMASLVASIPARSIQLCGRHSVTAVDVLNRGSLRKQFGSADRLRERLRPRAFHRRANAVRAAVAAPLAAGGWVACPRSKAFRFETPFSCGERLELNPHPSIREYNRRRRQPSRHGEVCIR